MAASDGSTHARRTFKDKNTLDARRAEAARIRAQYPDSIPVICEKTDRSDIIEMEKKKYIVPAEWTVGQFIMMIRKNISLGKEMALFVFVDQPARSLLPTLKEHKILPGSSEAMLDIYNKYKDEDGFVYFIYSGENTFG